MTVKTGQAISGAFNTIDTTGALSALTGGTATLYQQGTVTATALSITGSNPYKWAGTAPTLTAGDFIQIYVAGTVSAVATGGFVWGDIADTKRVSDLNDAATAPTAAAVGTAVWVNATREVTGGTVTTTATATISSATAASIAAGAMGMRTHHTFAQAITSTSSQNLSGATKLWYAVKANADDPDTAAIVMIEKTAGLQYLLGAAAGTATAGTITVAGTTGAWSVTPKLSAAAEGLLTAYVGGVLPSEVKALIGTDTEAVWDGDTAFSRGIVQATS